MMWEEGYKTQIRQQEIIIAQPVAMVLPPLILRRSLTKRQIIKTPLLEIRRQTTPQAPTAQTPQIQPLVIQLLILLLRIRHPRITLLRQWVHQLLTPRPCQTQEWTLFIHQIA